MPSDHDTLFSLSGRTALISGGSAGIGLAIADAYVRRGVRTYICARNLERCSAAAKELSRHGECFPLEVDVSSLSSIKALARAFLEREPALDILINNAGAGHYAPFEDFPEEAWDGIFDLNLKSVFFMTQAFLPMLKAAVAERRRASVINIGSVSGTLVSESEAYSYSTSKAGLNYLTRKLARRLARDTITVNAVSPGPVDVGLMAEMDEAFRERARSEVPLKRMAKPEEVAAAAIYLASDAGAFITGTILPIDGGLTGCRR